MGFLADTVPPRNDFVCMIGCVSGRDQVLATAGNKSVTLNESYFNPPYTINNGDNAYNISYKTVAVTAYHYDGTLVYNAHNLYGMLETLATTSALQSLRNKRQFILTRCESTWLAAYMLFKCAIAILNMYNHSFESLAEMHPSDLQVYFPGLWSLCSPLDR